MRGDIGGLDLYFWRWFFNVGGGGVNINLFLFFSFSSLVVNLGNNLLINPLVFMIHSFLLNE